MDRSVHEVDPPKWSARENLGKKQKICFLQCLRSKVQQETSCQGNIQILVWEQVYLVLEWGYFTYVWHAGAINSVIKISKVFFFP